MKPIKPVFKRPEEGWRRIRDKDHPGAVLLKYYLEPLGMTVHRLALLLKVPPTRINDLVRGRRAVTADTALRLARFFGNSAEYWLQLQTDYDLNVARHAGSERKAKLDIKPLGRDLRHKIPAAS